MVKMKKNQSKNNNIFTFLVKNRFVAFVLFIIISFLTHYFFTDSFFPKAETQDLWFYSGTVMVLFSILFIEPYYTSPKNVIANAIPLILVFISIKDGFNNLSFWWIAIIFLLLLLLASIVAMALEDKNKSPESKQNLVSNWIKNLVVIFGKGKFLYSCMFFYFLLSYRSVNDPYVFVLFIYWFVILAIDPKSFHNEFWNKTSSKNQLQIGEIFGVQSKKIFLVKLFEDKKDIKKFDVVKFKHSMRANEDVLITGMVFDTYLLNQEKWAKVLQLKESKSKVMKYDDNIVYLPESENTRDLNINSFVGIVTEGSNIGKIKFEYSKKTDDLQEGDLLELYVGRKKLFYQVVNGMTEKEHLEERNETSFIEGEALQLGEWDPEDLSFNKFGWVPTINTAIFKANTTGEGVSAFNYPEYKLGTIPGTSLPSVVNLKDAISHHLALLGVTGSGKSFLAREIIKQLLLDTKVVCVDFTGEWQKELDGVIPTVSLNASNINDFLNNDDKKIGIIELPTMSNTVRVIEATEKIFSMIFDHSKKAYDDGDPKKVCLVLEEAHTIVPESSFLGVNNWDSKAIVNKIGQIALQGRKYGVGMLIIAQRTANVSKTVLTQCNTVVCFQAFDETSFIFLGNYVGKDLVQTMPNLKQYHAIVAGKAIKSNMPMIIDLTRHTDEEVQDQ